MKEKQLEADVTDLAAAGGKMQKQLQEGELDEQAVDKFLSFYSHPREFVFMVPSPPSPFSVVTNTSPFPSRAYLCSAVS